MKYFAFIVLAAAGCQTTPLTYADVHPRVAEPDRSSFVYRATVDSFFGLPRYENARPAPRLRDRAFGR